MSIKGLRTTNSFIFTSDIVGLGALAEVKNFAKQYGIEGYIVNPTQAYDIALEISHSAIPKALFNDHTISVVDKLVFIGLLTAKAEGKRLGTARNATLASDIYEAKQREDAMVPETADTEWEMDIKRRRMTTYDRSKRIVREPTAAELA